MIITEQKPFAEILENLKSEKKIIIIGCGLCAKTAQTGGEKQVKEMSEKLRKEGVQTAVHDVLDAVCDERLVKLFINKHKEEISRTDSILILSCGAGVQAFKQVLSGKKLHPGLNTLFLATEKRLGEFYQFCSLCGNCVLDLTSGICPVTRCPKGYVNGPCGGAKNRKCEANPENDCVWHIIFEAGIDDRIRDRMIELKDHKKQFHPRKIYPKGKAVPHA
ncbi:MAG: methylenetetrahydrofolate reductase C-terminal domain-containing protein [bacterium]|nr:methylenetetrahydrofolate reductase C-terminal domain-containing protein [bacterium]